MAKVNKKKCVICERVILHGKVHMCQTFGPSAAYEATHVGRPAVAGAPRAEFVRARVTAEEKARLLVSAETLGLSLSEYLREKLGL